MVDVVKFVQMSPPTREPAYQKIIQSAIASQNILRHMQPNAKNFLIEKRNTAHPLMTMSQTTLGSLRRADGSATYSQGGYTVIAAVNGPIEVQRRDEIPDEAAIEVNIRPAVGVGGT